MQLRTKIQAVERNVSGMDSALERMHVRLSALQSEVTTNTSTRLAQLHADLSAFVHSSLAIMREHTALLSTTVNISDDVLYHLERATLSTTRTNDAIAAQTYLIWACLLLLLLLLTAVCAVGLVLWRSAARVPLGPVIAPVPVVVGGLGGDRLKG